MSDTVETQPLTDEDLTRLERVLAERPDHTIPDLEMLGACYSREIDRDDVDKLVAEVRRLRSDEWLEKAAQEIAHDMWASDSKRPLVAPERLFDILSKHRDTR